MKHIAYPLAVGNGHTRVIEAGKGPAILFLHGLGARADRWTGTVERFGRLGFRAIACGFLRPRLRLQRRRRPFERARDCGFHYCRAR